MFLFDSIPWYSALMWFVVLGALIGLNELVRWSKKAAIALFIVLSIIFTIFVWPQTAGAGSSTGTWFHWVKVHSALAGCIGFMLIRYNPRIAAMKYALWFPPAILALNIAEAVIRDFQVSGMHGMVDGVFMVGGSWNIMNGIAGILNLVTICGWVGIFVTRDRFQDMVWPDMMWFWIIAYDLWNFAYVYNCVGDHAFYAGAALLISCTIPAFFLRKGAWLQHRAHTLAFWMMFTMAVPSFVTDSKFAVDASHNTTALFVVSFLSLLANIAVVVYQVRVIVTKKRHPLRDELFVEQPSYQRLAAERPEAAGEARTAEAAAAV